MPSKFTLDSFIQQGIFKLFLDQVSEVAFLYSDNKEFVAVNRSFQNTTGFDESRVFGRSISEFSSDQSSRDETGRYRISLKTINDSSVEFYAKETNIELEDTTLTLFIGQQPNSASSMEEILEKSSRMVDLGKMSASIVHEIATPLAIIEGNAVRLSRNLDKDSIDNPKYSEAIHAIQKASTRITRIIRSVKSAARDGTNDPLEVTPLEEILENVLEICRYKMKLRSIDLINDTIPPSVKIECRATQIEQVLVNLISNSFDAVCDLAERWVKVRFDDLGPDIELRIIDSGKGIPREIQDQILNPFFTTKPIGVGTGIGLSIARKLIEEHRGVLRLDTDCENTCFVVRLPKA